MKFVFNVKINCEDSLKCHEQIKSKIETLTGKIKNTGHVSIHHDNKNHQIFLFLYDKDGVNESLSHGKVLLQKSDKVKKFKGTIPTETQIKKIF